jgi:hypothetical protein
MNQIITGQQFLDVLGTNFIYEMEFRYPNTYINLVDKSFTEDTDTNYLILSQKLEIKVETIRSILNRLYFVLNFSDEKLDHVKNRGHFWIRTILSNTTPASPETFKTIHFYGHKGGQARTSTMFVLAQHLAAMGWQVLCIDMDVEAPSLDVIFGFGNVALENSVLGIRFDEDICPLKVDGDFLGTLDAISFRPSDNLYDLDSIALAMELAMSPLMTEKIIGKINEIAKKYNVVLIDHRTGLSSSIPPWINMMPGPVIFFSRMDNQWRHSLYHIESLWKLYPQNPGLLISFKPEQENSSYYYSLSIPQSDAILEKMASAMSANNPELDISTDDLRDRWIVWPHSRDIQRGLFNKISRTIYNDQLVDITRMLELDTAPTMQSIQKAMETHPSGSKDEGDFIFTNAMQKLTSNNNFWFILGRKGTGKTRLLKELASRQLGIPLLLDDNDNGTIGITANSTQIVLLKEATERNPEYFWWTLVLSALETKANRTDLSTHINQNIHEASLSMSKLLRILDINKPKEPIVYLIDGLETAFTSAETYKFLDALFRVWSTIDTDFKLRNHLKFRIFIRTDLANRGYENFEQLSHGKILELRWSTQYILNFVLSRIRVNEWYQNNFPNATQRIIDNYEMIIQGNLELKLCEDILLMIFPTKLNRLNMLTTTFLRTWFSDDPKGTEGYYPRIYDEFLRQLTTNKISDGGKIDQRAIFTAHEKATIDFLSQVQVELKNLVSLESQQIQPLIEAFRGMSTPFYLDKIVTELSFKTSIDKKDVRDALNQMKNIGIFEERMGHSGQWRVGRLFKTSLRMKYVRGTKKNTTDDKAP